MGRIYLEPVFLVNMLMDLLTLYIAGRLSGQRARLWRYLAASVLGGLYAAMQLLPFCTVLGNLWVKVLFSVAMAALAWRIRGWLVFLKGWAALVGVTAVGGGGALAAKVLIDNAGPLYGTVHLSENALLLAFLGAASMTLFSATALRKKGGVTARYCVRVWSRGRCFELDAMLDTGNLLREPLSGLPVVIVDGSIGPRLLGGAGTAVEIPFSTAGGISTLRAVPAERMEVLRGGKWRFAGDVYLAACKGRLAHGVEALLPPATLE